MTETPTQGWRGSPELWLDAAQEALLDSGVEAVKIQPLAQKLNLSRTSFYWFFKNREELLDALLTRWRDKNTGNLVQRAGAYADTVAEAMLNVMDLWLDPALFDSRFELAVRSWAMQSADVLAEVHKADAERIAAEAKAKMEDFVARRTKTAESKIAQAESQAIADVRAAAAEAAVTAASSIMTQSVKGSVADGLIAKGIQDVRSKLN